MPEPKQPRIVRCDGTEQIYPPANGRYYTLEEMQNALRMPGNPEPFIQAVPMASKEEMLLCEENGIMLELPRNDSATVYTALDVYQQPGVGILGNVLICPMNMVQ